MTTLFLTFAALIAFLLSTLSGGGAGLMLLPLLAMVLPHMSVPAALTVGTVASSLSRLGLFWHDIRWPIVWRFVPGAVPGVVFGALLLRWLNPLYLELLLGLFLLLNLRRALRPRTLSAANGQAKGITVMFVGLVAGWVSGLTGAVGVLFNRFYFSQGLGPNQVVATRAANEVLLHLTKLAIYASLGLLSADALRAGAAIAVGAVIATMLAKQLIGQLASSRFQRIGYAAMVLSGVLMLSSAVKTLATTENLRATLVFIGDEIEVTGWWHSSSLTLEWEWDEGLAVEQSVSLRHLPPLMLARIDEVRNGDEIVKVEEVWHAAGAHYFEVYLNRDGRIEKQEIEPVDGGT